MSERFKAFFGILAGGAADFRPGIDRAFSAGEDGGQAQYKAPGLLQETASGKATERHPFPWRAFDSVQFFLDGSLEYEFPLDVLIDASQEMRIVKTDLVHQGALVATVKEKISLGDYALSFRGVLVGREGAFPEEELKRLRQFFQAGKAFQVSSLYLGALGITDVVLERISYMSAEGYPDTVGFTIDAISDKAVELIISGSF